MKSFIRVFLAGFILAIYIYSVNFTFLPVSGKQILGILGVFVFIFSKNKGIPHCYLVILSLAILLNLWGILVVLVNGTNQFIYVNDYLISIITSFFGAFFIIKFVGNEKLQLIDFIRIIAWVVFLESILTIIIRINPGIYQFVNSLQEFQVAEEHKEELTTLYRMTGIGNAVYFGVLPSCALGTLCCAYLASHNKKRAEMILYLFMLFIIMIVSFLIARYSLIVSAIAIILFLYYQLKHKFFLFFVSILFVPLFIWAFSEVLEKIVPEEMYSWALDAFDKNEGSTRGVLDWYSNTNFPLKTLLLGDGLYTEGSHYYKRVDIGIFRQIFYGGFLGLYLILFIHFKVSQYAYKLVENKDYKYLLLSLLTCFLASMLKGDISMLNLFILMLVITKSVSNKKPSQSSQDIRN